MKIKLEYEIAASDEESILNFLQDGDYTGILEIIGIYSPKLIEEIQ